MIYWIWLIVAIVTAGVVAREVAAMYHDGSIDDHIGIAALLTIIVAAAWPVSLTAIGVGLLIEKWRMSK